MTVPTLFRSEVADARKDKWLGEVQIAQPLPITIVATASIVLVSLCLAYAGFANYTRRVHASGILMPSAGLIAVVSPSAGLISSAAVAEGNQVRKGELLFTISLDATSSDGPTQERVIEQLKLQKASAEKERDLRRATAKVEKQSLANQMETLTKQRDRLSEQIKAQGASVSALKERTDTLRQAVKGGIARDSEFQTQNYFFNQALAQLGQYEQLYLQMEGRIFEIGANLALFDSKLDQEINQMGRGILQLEEQITVTQAKRAIEVRAPADGTLTSIRVHAGEQVGMGAPLLTVLPSTGKLHVHLYVDSSAIGFIDKGQSVIMRYAAFPFQRYGLYKGSVAEVTHAPIGTGGDDLPSRGVEQKARTSEAVYRIVVDPAVAFVETYGERRPLEAGMKVEADIAIETRPLYRYILDPFNHLQRSVGLVTGGTAR